MNQGILNLFKKHAAGPEEMIIEEFETDYPMGADYNSTTLKNQMNYLETEEEEKTTGSVVKQSMSPQKDF